MLTRTYLSAQAKYPTIAISRLSGKAGMAAKILYKFDSESQPYPCNTEGLLREDRLLIVSMPMRLHCQKTYYSEVLGPLATPRDFSSYFTSC